MIEGSGSGSRAGSESGSIPLTSGSGSGSRRPKNMWIRIRIRNTGLVVEEVQMVLSLALFVGLLIGVWHVLGWCHISHSCSVATQPIKLYTHGWNSIDCYRDTFVKKMTLTIILLFCYQDQIPHSHSVCMGSEGSLSDEQESSQRCVSALRLQAGLEKTR
jgi:hypothetical protein